MQRNPRQPGRNRTRTRTRTRKGLRTRALGAPLAALAAPLVAAAAVALLTALGGCAEGEDRERQAGPQVARHYASELNVDLDAMSRRPDGLYIQDARVGDGARADSGDVVTVHYTGWLPNGTQFDSSRDGDRPFEVAIGYGRVIQGWDRGIVGMRVGGQRRLVIPAELAYGTTRRGAIPANSTLVFDVEMLDVVNRSGPEAEQDGAGGDAGS